MTDQRERRLLHLAAAFLLLYALILTLAPAVRERTWSVSYRTSQWIAVLVWIVVIVAEERFLSRALPNRDPYLLPLAALLSGWGILTISRLDAGYGLRQSAWLVASGVAMVLIVRYVSDLGLLRRYKYVLLGTGLTLTALTLVLGTSPTGVGPRLWLGCCGLFLQPSEPLKLLLVVYLAAYLADHAPFRERIFPLLLPTLFVTGVALLLLIVQRDLGSASIFILLHTCLVYLATGKRRVLIVSATALILAGLVGFFLVDVIHFRLEAWLDPWQDPSGRSYQLIQSILAIANGGVVGRGPGLGNPSLVPVAHSDFIFSAIAEENGFLGSIGMFTVYALLFSRGLITAIRSSERFHRLLAGGLTAYLGIQALLIIAGDLRLLPLTGITLPFVSYGGSSLLTAFVATALLLKMSDQSEEVPSPVALRLPYEMLAGLLAFGIVMAALSQSWWAIIRGPDLLARTDNARRSIADRYVPRGRLLDRQNQPIDFTTGTSGSFSRIYGYPELAAVTGYTHPAFGQAGLEASLDDYLRGLQGNPASLVWWDQMVYGTPPPGLDVRLSIDLKIQKQADTLLGPRKGAIVLLDAHSGEILAMASHPTYNPNDLDTIGASLATNKDAPLLNRASQGMYPPGNSIVPLFAASGISMNSDSAIKAGVFRKLGFYDMPKVRMDVAAPSENGEVTNIRVSPLQMALAVAAVSNDGQRPAPRIAMAVNTLQQGWIVLPALEEPSGIFAADVVERAVPEYQVPGQAIWEWSSTASSGAETITWYIGGTVPHWQGTPLSVAILLESGDVATAQRIGEQLLRSSSLP